MSVKERLLSRRRYNEKQQDVKLPLIDRNGEVRCSTNAAQYGSIPSSLTDRPPSKLTNSTDHFSIDQTLFTNQGKHLIDFVLAYRPTDLTAAQTILRQAFERKLRERGLHLESEEAAASQDGKTCFVKVHAPWDTVMRMAEINRVRVPVRTNQWLDSGTEAHQRESNWTRRRLCCELEQPYNVADRGPSFTMEFQRNRMEQFEAAADRGRFFTQIQRVNIVWDIIQRTTVDISGIAENLDSLKTIGHFANINANYLFRKGVYCAVYPLHDSDSATSEKPIGLWPLRPWLAECWARPARLFKRQPLDQIRAYFGEKVSLYFAWLGFYTASLVPLSIIGLMVFIYGLFCLSSDIPASEVCSGQTIICRKCPSHVCPFTRLEDDCMHATVTAVFNNFGTPVFAFIAALWAVLFLELWKRRQAKFACKWDTSDLGQEYEPPRPDFVAQAVSQRRNPVSGQWEPHIPARSRAQRLIASIASVTFLVSLVLAVLFGIIVYKVIMVSLYSHVKSGLIEAVGTDMFTTITASIINAILIMILEKIYEKIAWKLTLNEFPRTDTDLETSFTYKMYVFQFVNYYAALFYLAFFAQIAAAGSPAQDRKWTARCPPSGCIFAVSTQLAVILIVKQGLNNVTELGIPWLRNLLRMRRSKDVMRRTGNTYTRYEKDFDLTGLDHLPLFAEYFEMVIQFGFVTMFVAAFPLAPLFALINNLIEIRLDAYKFLSINRRILPLRAANIGNWYEILEFVSGLSVITNALLIAFSTDLVERAVFMGVYSRDGSLNGYINWTLSVFDTADWNRPSLTKQGGETILQCRYSGHYTPPGDPNPYWYGKAWWRVMLARLAFVLLFEHCVFATAALIQYIVPDTPESVLLHIQRNRHLVRSLAYKSEVARSKAVAEKQTAARRLQQKRNEEALRDDASLDAVPKKSPKFMRMFRFSKNKKKRKKELLDNDRDQVSLQSFGSKSSNISKNSKKSNKDYKKL